MAQEELINTNPEGFMKALSQREDGFSLEYAEALDSIDPERDLNNLFRLGAIKPFAGHSLGPVFKPASKIDPSPSAHQISPQELKFNNQLDLLQKKIEDLTIRTKEAIFAYDFNNYKNLKKAQLAAIALKKGLKEEGASYFRKHKDPQIFKVTCDQLLKKAHVDLDQHRGWAEFLINLTIGLSTLGIGLLFKGAINLANNQAFFFACKTESSQILTELEKNINKIAP